MAARRSRSAWARSMKPARIAGLKNHALAIGKIDFGFQPAVDDEGVEQLSELLALRDGCLRNRHFARPVMRSIARPSTGTRMSWCRSCERTSMSRCPPARSLGEPFSRWRRRTAPYAGQPATPTARAVCAPLVRIETAIRRGDEPRPVRQPQRACGLTIDHI
jgi:hypothetical protein